MILDGDAIALGDDCVSVATAVSPIRRIRALDFALPHTGLVLSHGVAAWVHGCGPYPRHLDFTVQAQHRFGLPLDPRVRIRRYRLKLSEDTELIGDVRVTTPLRTAIHLLIDEICDVESLTSAGLLVGKLSTLERELLRAPRVRPKMRELGLERLRTIQPLVTL